MFTHHDTTVKHVGSEQMFTKLEQTTCKLFTYLLTYMTELIRDE